MADPPTPTAAAAQAAAASAPKAPVAAAAPCPPAKKRAAKGGSTTVSVDDVNHKVTIETCMEFSGSGATREYADAAKKQIEDTWTGTMTRNGKPYDVVVKVDAKVKGAGAACPNCDPIRVDRGNARMNQTLFGAGPGNQAADAATDAARPRRIAHEYGHTLGLPDDYVDSPNGGSVPKDPNRKNNIMSETWPDAEGVLPHPGQDHYEAVLKSHGW